MTTFAVGDRVKFTAGSYVIPYGTCGSVVETDPEIRVLFDGESEDFYVHRNEVVAIPGAVPVTSLPTFTKSDKVVAVESNDHLGIKAGVVYTVVGSHNDSGGTILNVESSSGRRAWADSKRFKQYVPKPQQFELRYGDKVKNLHTGRVGQVFRNSRGELYVYDTVRPIRDGVPAAALEGYEDEYPGTYDIVFRRDSEEPW